MPVDKNSVAEWLKSDEGKEFEQELTVGLRTTNGNLKGEKTELEGKFTIASNELATTKQELETFRKNAGNPDADTQAQLDAMQGKVTASEGLASQYQKKLVNNAVSNEIIDEIVKQGGNPDWLAVNVRTKISTVVDDKGAVEIIGIGADGKKLYDADGKPGGIAQVVKNMKADPKYAGAFTSNFSGGSGNPTQQGKTNKQGFASMTKEQLSDTALIEKNLFN